MCVRWHWRWRPRGSRARAQCRCKCCEQNGVQCNAGCKHEAGRWAARGGSRELCVDWSGHRVTRPMVNGRRPSGTGGFGWRSQPIPCTCARCPGSDPRLPCWSSACLPSLSLLIHQAHSESHIPSLHHNPSHLPVHPAHPIQPSEPNHTQPAHPTDPASNHLSFASGIPVVTSRPHQPGPPLTHSNSNLAFKTRDPHTSRLPAPHCHSFSRPSS